MQTYIVLTKYTVDGIKRMKDSPTRLKRAIEMTEKFGGEFVDFHLTMGRYDAVYVAQFPDDEAAAKAVLTIAQSGAVETETLKAFSQAEYEAICAALA